MRFPCLLFHTSLAQLVDAREDQRCVACGCKRVAGAAGPTVLRHGALGEGKGGGVAWHIETR
jgi:hypothetical protein